MGTWREAAGARWLAGLVVCMVSAGAAAAAEQSTAAEVVVRPEESATGAVESPAPPATPATPPPARATAEDGIRAQLNGTRWALQLTPLSVEGGKPQKDTVTFDGKQVSSERLMKAGFPTSNYTLTVGDDGMAVWETMQTKEGDGVVFWRGELRGSTMRGVLSKHPVEGQPEDFSFSGQETGGKHIGEAPSGSADTAASSPDAAPPAETSKKKKQKKSRR